MRGGIGNLMDRARRAQEAADRLAVNAELRRLLESVRTIDQAEELLLLLCDRYHQLAGCDWSPALARWDADREIDRGLARLTAEEQRTFCELLAKFCGENTDRRPDERVMLQDA